MKLFQKIDKSGQDLVGIGSELFAVQTNVMLLGLPKDSIRWANCPTLWATYLTPLAFVTDTIINPRPPLNAFEGYIYGQFDIERGQSLVAEIAEEVDHQCESDGILQLYLLMIVKCCHTHTVCQSTRTGWPTHFGSVIHAASDSEHTVHMLDANASNVRGWGTVQNVDTYLFQFTM